MRVGIFENQLPVERPDSPYIQSKSIQSKSAASGGIGLGGNTQKLNSRHRLTARSSDRGGDRLSQASSLRPYLQGFAPPGVNRPLRDSTSRRDPDFYRLYDDIALPFQSEGLLLSCELRNRSNAPISIALLDQQGKLIPGQRKIVSAGQSFVYPETLSDTTFYIKITADAPKQKRYELNLSIINS